MAVYSKSPEAIAALSPEEFHVTQNSVTERPGTGKYPVSYTHLTLPTKA